MQKENGLKPKEDAATTEGCSRMSVESKSIKASPSAKSSVSNAGHLSLRRAISLEFVRVVRQSVEEDQGQESNHSVPDLPVQPTRSTGRAAEIDSPKDFERKPRLNLPPATDRRWAQVDEDPKTTLDNILKGDASKKIKTMVEVMYQVCHNTFSVKKGSTPKPAAGPSRRQRQIKDLRGELKLLKRRWWEASEEEREAWSEISSEIRRRLINL